MSLTESLSFGFAQPYGPTIAQPYTAKQLPEIVSRIPWRIIQSRIIALFNFLGHICCPIQCHHVISYAIFHFCSQPRLADQPAVPGRVVAVPRRDGDHDGSAPHAGRQQGTLPGKINS